MGKGKAEVRRWVYVECSEYSVRTELLLLLLLLQLQARHIYLADCSQ